MLARHVSDLIGPSSGAFCRSCIHRLWYVVIRVLLDTSSRYEAVEQYQVLNSHFPFVSLWLDRMLCYWNLVNALGIYTRFYILCVLPNFFGLLSDNLPREFYVSNQCIFLLPPPQVCVCVCADYLKEFVTILYILGTEMLIHSNLTSGKIMTEQKRKILRRI